MLLEQFGRALKEARDEAECLRMRCKNVSRVYENRCVKSIAFSEAYEAFLDRPFPARGSQPATRCRLYATEDRTREGINI